MEMTDEQKRALAIARARRLRFAGGSAAREEPESEPERGLIDNIRGGLQSFQRGQLFSFGDEVVGAGRALTDYGIAALLGEDTGDQSFGERYRMYRDDERANQEAFADESPGLSMALELVGAIAAPVKGPRGAREAAPIPRTALVRAMQRAAPQGGYRALAGRGAAEGALYGAGTADEVSDIADEAQTGALIGGAFGAGFRGLQGAGEQIAKRRVAQDLVKDGRQTPIWIAEKDSRLAEFYRNFLGKSFFARKAMSDQEKPFREAVEAGVDRATRRKATKLEALDAASEAIDENMEQARRLIQDQTDGGKHRLSAERQRLLRETQEVLDDDVRNLRATAAQEAVPDNYRAEVLKGVDLENPVEVSKRLNRFWKDDAFQMVKQRQFEWDTSLPGRLKEEFANDPSLIVSMGDEPELIEVLARRFGMDNASVDDVLGRLSEWAGEGGVARGDEMFLNPKIAIDGDALMEIRNFFAKRANKGGDGYRASRAIKERFDDMIRTQLDDEAASAFQDQLQRYTTNLTYRNATRAAADSGGRWTPKQWLSAGKKVGDYSVEGVPLQRQADEVLERSREADVRSAQDAARRAEETAGLTEAKKKALREAKDARKAARRKLDVKGERQRLTDAVRKAKERSKEMNKRTIAENPSGLSEWLTTTLMGNIALSALPTAVLGPAAGPIALGAVAGASKGLASPGGQRFVAGQSGMQAAMRNLSDDEKMRLLARLIRQGATRSSTLGAVE